LQLQKKERQTIQDAINSNLQGLKTEKTGLHCSYCISESSSYGRRLLVTMHKVIKNKELKQSRDMGVVEKDDLYCPFCKRVIKHYLIFSS
ncbi:MAG: hypothetical protein KGY74_09420, partial [Candidatus Cloacimonetes bacterium]|nr:hypothetical protein [Candidatus Cloacimonadota bacterium]